MIDLSRQIRDKTSKLTWHITPGKCHFLMERNGYAFVYSGSLSDLERDYENIPRKPREWYFRCDGSGVLHHNDIAACHRTCIRVIEWPEDAPLPDMPGEG